MQLSLCILQRTVDSVHNRVHNEQCPVYSVYCILKNVQLILNIVLYLVYSEHCRVHIPVSVYCLQYTVYSKVYSVKCKVYSVGSTSVSVQYTVYSIQYTVYSEQSTVWSVEYIYCIYCKVHLPVSVCTV